MSTHITVRQWGTQRPMDTQSSLQAAMEQQAANYLVPRQSGAPASTCRIHASLYICMSIRPTPYQIFDAHHPFSDVYSAHFPKVDGSFRIRTFDYRQRRISTIAVPLRSKDWMLLAI